MGTPEGRSRHTWRHGEQQHEHGYREPPDTANTLMAGQWRGRYTALGGKAYRTGRTRRGTAEEQAAALSTSLEALADSRMIPDLGAGLAADLLGWAFAEIDFTAIARSYLRDWHAWQSRKGEAGS